MFFSVISKKKKKGSPHEQTRIATVSARSSCRGCWTRGRRGHWRCLFPAPRGSVLMNLSPLSCSEPPPWLRCGFYVLMGVDERDSLDGSSLREVSDLCAEARLCVAFVCGTGLASLGSRPSSPSTIFQHFFNVGPYDVKST